MTVSGWFQILFYSAILLAVTKPVGLYVLRVYDGSLRWLAPIERVIYRVCGVDADEDQHWTRYAAAVLLFSAASLLVTYEPRPGGGSVFSLLLPAVEQPALAE